MFNKKIVIDVLNRTLALDSTKGTGEVRHFMPNKTVLYQH